MKRNAVAIPILLALSLLAIGLLAFLLYGRDALPESNGFLQEFLPAFNAVCNSITATFIVLALLAVKRGDPKLHGRRMSTAFLVSCLFLLGYLTHHTLHGDTLFLGQGGIRIAYLVLLASHIIFSIIGLPLVLVTLYLGKTDQRTLHRRWAKFTAPIWLYVSLTGVMVYGILRFWPV